MKQFAAISLVLLAFACSKGNFNGATATTVTPEANEYGSDGKPGSSTVGGQSGGNGQATVDGQSAGETRSNPQTTTDGISNNGNSVVFGGDGVFRVGDGAASASSCKRDLNAFKVEGESFSFLFDVLEDNATVNFTVSRVCAIDYGTNRISIVKVDGNQILTTVPMPEQVVDNGDAPLKPFQTLKLAKGSYAILVESLANPELDGDHDDFIIGNIAVLSDKPVKGTLIRTK